MKSLLVSLLLSATGYAQFIQAPSVTPGTASAAISFSTCAASAATLDYGTTTSYGSTLSDMTAVSSHSFTLPNLASSTTYFYKIVSTDSLGNTVTSVGSSFKTNGAPPAATVSVTPPSLSFPSATVGKVSAVQYVTITSTGTASVTITKGFSFTGAEFGFGGSGTCKVNQILAQGQSCTAGVAFTPTGTGNHNGTLALNDSASGNPQIVPLNGTIAGTTPVHKVTLNWTDPSASPSPVTGVLVLRKLSGGAFAAIATLGPTGASYVDSAVVSGQAYSYEIETVSGSLQSVPSNMVVATIPVP